MALQETTAATARIGMVNFINTAPIYEVWQQTVARPDWRVVEAAPTTLNRMLHDQALDLGFISSHEYAAHPHCYRLLPGLSISATGPVGSVFLFASRPVAELSGRLVRLSGQSQTSAALVKIILERFYRVKPCYLSSGAVAAGEVEGTPEAVLAIGDEALRLAASGRYPLRLDLGQAWQQQTGLPFVFAVWAVREEFWRARPETVRAIHQELLRCLAEGRQRLRAISEQVAPRIPMSVEACHAYLAGMEYDLAADKQEALRTFFQYLVQRGEADPAAVQLRFCGEPDCRRQGH